MLQSTTVEFFARKSKIRDRNLYRRFCIKIFFQRHEKWTRVVLPAAKNRLRHYLASAACVYFLEIFIKKINHKVGQASGLWSRGGMSPSFCARAEFELWVLSPDKPKPTLIHPRACFKPELFTNKTRTSKLEPPFMKIRLVEPQARASFIASQKIISSHWAQALVRSTSTSQ